MTAQELIDYLSNSHCPKNAEIQVFDEDNYTMLKPQVIWWSGDRKVVYLGKI